MNQKIPLRVKRAAASVLPEMDPTCTQLSCTPPLELKRILVMLGSEQRPNAIKRRRMTREPPQRLKSPRTGELKLELLDAFTIHGKDTIRTRVNFTRRPKPRENFKTGNREEKVRSVEAKTNSHSSGIDNRPLNRLHCLRETD